MAVCGFIQISFSSSFFFSFSILTEQYLGIFCIFTETKNRSKQDTVRIALIHGPSCLGQLHCVPASHWPKDCHPCLSYFLVMESPRHLQQLTTGRTSPNNLVQPCDTYRDLLKTCRAYRRHDPAKLLRVPRNNRRCVCWGGRWRAWLHILEEGPCSERGVHPARSEPMSSSSFNHQ